MTLSVVEPITTILGGPDLYLEGGSTVNLTCIVHHLPEPPLSITWSKDGEVSLTVNLKVMKNFTLYNKFTGN